MKAQLHHLAQFLSTETASKAKPIALWFCGEGTAPEYCWRAAQCLSFVLAAVMIVSQA